MLEMETIKASAISGLSQNYFTAADWQKSTVDQKLVPKTREENKKALAEGAAAHTKPVMGSIERKMSAV